MTIVILMKILVNWLLYWDQLAIALQLFCTSVCTSKNLGLLMVE